MKQSTSLENWASLLSRGAQPATGRWPAAAFVRLAFLLVALSFVALIFPRALARRTTTQQSGAAPREGPSSITLPTYQWIRGQSGIYHFEYSSIATADLRLLFHSDNSKAGQRSGEQLPAPISVASVLRGELVVTIVGSHPGRAEVLYVLRNAFVQLVINGQEQVAQQNDVAKDLSRGVLVELTPEGRIIDFYTTGNGANLSKDFTRTLLAAVQFVVPAPTHRDAHSWTVREEDRNGPYIARYTVLSNSTTSQAGGLETNKIAIRKTKIRYLPAVTQKTVPGPENKAESQRALTSKGSFEGQFDPTQRRLVSLQGTETQETAIHGKRVAHSEVTLRLTLTSTTELLPSEMRDIRRTLSTLKKDSSRLALFAPHSAEEIKSNIQRSELGTATLEGLLTQLAAADAKKEKSEETSLYLKFKALVYVHPDSSVRLGEIMSGAPASSLTFRILAGALGAAEHPEAQAALARAIEARPDDWPALSSLISALCAVRRPTPEAQNTMRQLANSSADSNISSAALLGLGNMARSLAHTDQKRSAEIVDELIQRLANSQTENAKRMLAQALGNAASPRIMPVISRLATDTSPAVRAAALDSLRAVPLPEADKLLIQALASDTDVRVRLEAAFALGFRSASAASFEAQSSALLGEKDEKVRAALLNNLAKMHQEFPAVRQFIENAAENDPSEYVRKIAREVLQHL